MSAEEEEKTTAKTIVDNSVNFDNFERSVNFRKLSQIVLLRQTNKSNYVCMCVCAAHIHFLPECGGDFATPQGKKWSLRSRIISNALKLCAAERFLFVVGSTYI